MDDIQELEVSSIIGEIADRLRFSATFAFAIGIILLIGTVVVPFAQEHSRDPQQLGSSVFSTVLTFGIALFLRVLARDFRARKPWTYGIVEHMVSLNPIYISRRLRKGISSESVRSAFGLDDF